MVTDCSGQVSHLFFNGILTLTVFVVPILHHSFCAFTCASDLFSNNIHCHDGANNLVHTYNAGGVLSNNPDDIDSDRLSNNNHHQPIPILHVVTSDEHIRVDQVAKTLSRNLNCCSWQNQWPAQAQHLFLLLISCYLCFILL
jgi:hypothetical protein